MKLKNRFCFLKNKYRSVTTVVCAFRQKLSTSQPTFFPKNVYFSNKLQSYIPHYQYKNIYTNSHILFTLKTLL